MVRVKALVASKSSHGRDALLRRIVEIEHECELLDGQDLFDDRPPRRQRPAEIEGDTTQDDCEATETILPSEPDPRLVKVVERI